jgi:hypothetical protein
MSAKSRSVHKSFATWIGRLRVASWRAPGRGRAVTESVAGQRGQSRCLRTGLVSRAGEALRSRPASEPTAQSRSNFSRFAAKGEESRSAEATFSYQCVAMDSDV